MKSGLYYSIKYDTIINVLVGRIYLKLIHSRIVIEALEGKFFLVTQKELKSLELVRIGDI